ncbi:MAG: cryptochrome/photolyase family protein [Actinomycetes bacterium]
MRTSLVWFRRDLRLDDNPAWATATAEADRVVAMFVLDARPLGQAGERRRSVLFSHLAALHADLRAHGGGLLLCSGDPTSVVPATAAAIGAFDVHVNADVSSYAQRRDRAVAAALGATPFIAHWGSFVHAPGAVRSPSSQQVHKVFTPFWKAWAQTPSTDWPTPGDAAIWLPGDDLVESTTLPPFEAPEELGGGAAAASRRLERWLADVDEYPDRRDVPADATGTSRLSADLRFGTLSPRHVVEVVGSETRGRAAFVRQLAWRDWYAHLLAEQPGLADHAMKPEMDGIAWRNDPAELQAWVDGATGYPIVDAGMRELRSTGLMHNRVRMITASFLVKDLLVDWRLGEAHFRRELVDFDLSQNVGNWQWVAGTGPDASPYFRIFNPILQSKKFDPNGEYIRRWVPELAELPTRALHAPWEAGPLELAAADVELGSTYPMPIVDHAFARDRTLAAYSAARGSAIEPFPGETASG